LIGKIKRTTADGHFSNCVRIRAKWKCQRCETDYTDRNRQGLQCSHLIGRGHYAVRYDPANALSLCTRCHHDMTAHPVAHVQLWRDVHGSIYGRDSSDQALNALLRRSTDEVRDRYARDNGKAIADHYRATFKDLEIYYEATEGEDSYEFESCKYR
jgi:hypothetical protein